MLDVSGNGRWMDQAGKQVGSIQYQNGNQSQHKMCFCSHHITPRIFLSFSFATSSNKHYAQTCSRFSFILVSTRSFQVVTMNEKMIAYTHFLYNNRSVPLTLAAATAFYSLRSRAASVQPLRFVPSGEPSSDHQNLERIREDWKQRNQGIGLRDVR